MKRVETVIYNGIRFNRYPDSDNHADRNYYRPHAGYIRRGVEALHREIYRAEVGPIPEGWHIHHKDGDPANNDPANLEAVSPAEHAERHAGQEISPRQREHLERARAKAAEWHGTPEGREWHAKHAKEAWKKREPERRECAHCGKPFESLTRRPSDRFCSKACKSAARVASGVDDIDRVCVVCGATFRVNRYYKTATCSRACGRVVAWQKRRQS